MGMTYLLNLFKVRHKIMIQLQIKIWVPTI
jgi:hypothetical protein